MLDMTSQYLHYCVVLLCEVWYIVYCCVLCDVTRDLLFTWYVVYQPLLLF